MRLVPKGLTIPILQGPLKGKKWIVGSSQHGCWLGSYEYEKQLLFKQHIIAGSIVFDLGAHVSFHTLLSSVLAGTTGKVYAFEPMPDNLTYLKKRLQLNNTDNVEVIAAAVCDKMGSAYFENYNSSFQGRLSDSGKIKVRTVGLDALIQSGEIEVPHYIKMDVEGAEVQVLEGAQTLLSKNHPTIFLATHGDDLQRQCCEMLSSLGYKLQSITERDMDTSDEILAIYS